jgi:hypothetical protein
MAFSSPPPRGVEASRAGGGALDVLTDPKTVTPLAVANTDWVERVGFPEVPVSCVGNFNTWRTVASRRLKFDESISIKEGRGVVLGVNHILKNVDAFHKRHLMLVDNFGVALALCKGRAASYGLLQICRRVAAYSLASNTLLSFRWITSETNPADVPSRRYEPRTLNSKHVASPHLPFWKAIPHQGACPKVSGREVRRGATPQWRAYLRNLSIEQKSRLAGITQGDSDVDDADVFGVFEERLAAAQQLRPWKRRRICTPLSCQATRRNAA